MILRCGGSFQPGQPQHRMDAVAAAHLDGRLQRHADCRPLGLAEQAAAAGTVELDARLAGGLAPGHAGNR
jgi:hypothetical protein